MKQNPYRILVLLRKDKRPTRYFDFYCFMCKNKVAELSGLDVIGFDDVNNIQNRATIGVRCGGRWRSGTCPIWYHYEEVR